MKCTSFAIQTHFKGRKEVKINKRMPRGSIRSEGSVTELLKDPSIGTGIKG